MAFVTDNLLALILFSPTLVALIILFLPSGEKKLIRWAALLGSLIPFAFALLLWFSFNKNLPGFQYESQKIWYGVVGSSFHLGVDGLSLTMVLLTT
jgi:NADH-quinone oxidoreductase subunit M